MTHLEPDWAGLYAKPEFTRLVRHRMSVSVRLMVIAMVLFFSIPFIASQFPALFHIKVIGVINVGLIFLISQYFIGAVIAYRYAVQMRQVDEQAAAINAAASIHAHHVHDAEPKPAIEATSATLLYNLEKS